MMVIKCIRIINILQTLYSGLYSEKNISVPPLDVNLVQVYIKNLEDGKMDIRRNQSIEKSVRSLSEGLCSDDRGNRALCNLLRKGGEAT